MPKVSLIIPTFNRPNHLKRILKYLADSPLVKKEFEVIVADSSSPENKIKNKEIVSFLQDFKVLHLNDYLESINPWQKYIDAMGCVKTGYCLFCSDDDFVIPKSVSLSVDFLENHPDFSVAHGQYFVFFLDSEGKIHWSSGYSPHSITAGNANVRLREHLSDYKLPTFSAVHKTEVLKIALQETVKFTSDNRFGELLPSMISLIYGKMKFLKDAPYAVLEVNSDSTGANTETIEDFIKNGSFKDKYGNFRDCLAEHLSRNSKLNLEESKITVDEAAGLYLKKNYPAGFQYLLLKRLKNAFRFFMPERYQEIKKSRIKSNLLREKNNFAVLIENSSLDYYEDFRKIRDCINYA